MLRNEEYQDGHNLLVVILHSLYVELYGKEKRIMWITSFLIVFIGSLLLVWPLDVEPRSFLVIIGGLLMFFGGLLLGGS